ncbi:MAG TPA: hypothetical protein VFA26_11345 [Gemmataceae bacterium]|nr:hypothetical protein [Gemmataceae bacterium]
MSRASEVLTKAAVVAAGVGGFALVAAPSDGTAPLGQAARNIGLAVRRTFHLGGSVAAGAINTVGGATTSVAGGSSGVLATPGAQGSPPVNPANPPTRTVDLTQNEHHYVGPYSTGYVVFVEPYGFLGPDGVYHPAADSPGALWPASALAQAQAAYNRALGAG